MQASNDFEQGCLNMKEWLKPIEERDEQTGDIITTANLTIDEGAAPNLWRCLVNIQKDKKNPNVYAKEPHNLTHACLTGDTIINTPNGDYMIKDLVGKTGLVYCYDETNKRKVVSTYTNVILTKQNADILKITMGDGSIIKCTPDHPILTNRGWVEAGKLSPNDDIINIT